MKILGHTKSLSVPRKRDTNEKQTIDDERLRDIVLKELPNTQTKGLSSFTQVTAFRSYHKFLDNNLDRNSASKPRPNHSFKVLTKLLLEKRNQNSGLKCQPKNCIKILNKLQVLLEIVNIAPVKDHPPALSSNPR